MKQGHRTRVRTFLCVLWLFAAAVFSVHCLAATNYPTWWRDVIDTNAVPNDYAPAIAGQLKWMATKAYDELQTSLPGGAGTSVASLVSGFSTSNNYVPVNLGQLKYVADPFYERLIEKGYTNAYPWTTPTTDNADFAAANLGQLKNVFSFDVASDADDDDLPDWWENHWFGGVTNWGGADDQDGDELANSNEYVWLTCPTNADTDGDGASDGEEISHSTNPLNNPGDTDGDGLSDDHEEVLGTDPDLPDTDGDWVSDGYEHEQNTDPVNPESAPILRLEVEGGEFYAKSTNLQIRIRGLVADELILAEALTMENSVTNPSSELVYFGLNNETNGNRSVCVAAVRGGTTTGFMATATIILDTVPPYLSVTNPSSGLITADRWVRIQGLATDGVSSVCVKLNGGWADGVSEGQFWKSRFMLSQGTNVIDITGADAAGNCVTQALTIVQNLSLDTNAPVMSLDLPSDFTVQGGVTNWNYGITTFGDETNLAFRGSIDDETAVVNVRVESPIGTSGPYNAGVGGRTQVWGEVILFEGSNRLVATAADAAGNVSTCLWTVVRDTNFMFRITSPLPWVVVNGDTVFVTCAADPEFSNAVVTVNGQSASIVAGSNLTFRTDAAVPLGDGVTKISACAVLSGQNYYADPNVTTYRITRWVSKTHGDSNTKSAFETCDNPYEYEIGRWHDEDTWDRDSKMYEHRDTRYWWGETWTGTVRDYSSGHCTTNVATNCPSGSTTFGLQKYRGSDYEAMRCDNSAHDGELGFINDSMIHDTELVYLQFPGLDYGRAPNESIDPAKITFRGQPGFWYNSNVTFIAELQCDTEYVIRRFDFDWPTYINIDTGFSWGSPYLPWIREYSGHLLQIGSVTMDVFQAEIIKPAGDAGDASRTNVTAGSFLDNTNNAGVPPFRYDWQGVPDSVSNWYRLDFEGDIDPDGFGYDWTLTAACGAFTNSSSPLPGHIPPSSISGNSVTGTLALEIMCGTTPIGYTNSKQIVIYRDHLQRDMENFVAENLTTNDSQQGVMRGGSNKLGFACHHSTTHAYKGEKGITAFWTNWAVLASVTVTNGYVVPALGPLTRGDIVAYYDYSTNLLHSQTCTGNSNDTWGANNKTLAEQDGWRFAIRAAGAHYTNWSCPSYPITITSYDKP